MSYVSNKQMAEIMSEIPPSNPHMEEDIYFEVIRNGYALYDGKKNIAVCTRCGHTWEIEPGEYSRMHGHKDTCPHCGEVLTCLSAGRGRDCYTEYHRILSFAEKDGTLWAVLNSIMPTFGNFGRPSLNRKVVAVYKLNSQEQTYWKLITPWGGESHYEKMREVKIPPAPRAPYFETKWVDHLYIDGFEEMIRRSDLKYLYKDGMECKLDTSIITYLSVQLKYHSVELLDKAGFTYLANIKLKGYGGCKGINWQADNLEKILKLPKRWARYLRPHNPTGAELIAYQHLSEEEKQLDPWLTVYDIVHSYMSEADYRKRVEKYMPFTRWIRYVNSQNTREKNYVLRTYEDYMEMATCLGMDISKNRIRFPKSLKEAHDEVTKRLKIIEDEELSKAIAAKARIVPDYRIGKLTILPAMSQEDLNKESTGLCHCVKGYGKKIVNNECWIFFIRNVDAPGTPFFTLETSIEGKLRQCRGLHNCNMTDEVRAFAEKFTRDLQKQIKSERKETVCQTA